MVLETKRLSLREMNPEDYEALFQVLGNPETMWHYPFTFDGQHVRDWIERNINRYRKDGFGLWAVCLKDTGEMIGDCGLTLQNINGRILPEIGYHIRRDCQRKGYAREAAKAVRDWAFQNTDYPALYSYCKYTNIPSIKTAESIGMRIDREYPDEVNGTTHVSAISRKEWLNELGMDYQYKRLDNNNFTGHSLDDFIRHQTVAECWRKIDNDWKLVPNVYEENWSRVQCREIAEDVAHHISLDQTGFGAFDGERIIGFATVSHRIFGAAAKYAQLVCFQISEEYRRQGIGRKLFSMACEEARRLGADKLYISAHSSKESQAAYRALGCTPAEEVNEGLAAAEPFDVQMEFRL